MNQKNFGIVGSSKDEFLQTDDCLIGWVHTAKL
jgi:hypothetical protein